VARADHAARVKQRLRIDSRLFRVHAHSAFNRGASEMVFYATFFQIPASGPLTLTDGVTDPEDCQLNP
jgi:hypothetical protein